MGRFLDEAPIKTYKGKFLDEPPATAEPSKPENPVVSLIKSQRGLTPTGFIPTSKQEAMDIPRVLGRQILPGARGEAVNPLTKGPMGLGLNMAGINETKGFIPAPETGYGQGFENAADAAQLVHGVLPVVEGVSEISKFGINPTKESLMNKAQKMTTEILQPSKGELQTYLKQGRQLPAVEQATNYMDEVKDYGQLRRRLDDVISGKFGERNSIMQEANKPIGREYVRPLIKEIKQQRSLGQAKPSELKDMKDVLSREFDFLRKNNLDTVGAQSRKEYLQDLTEKLLEHRDNGEKIITEPARHRALDSLRSALRGEIEKVDPRIGPINETYAGLQSAKELASGQEALAQKAIEPGLIDRIVNKIPIVRSIFRNPMELPIEIARGSLNREKSLSSSTRKISDLVKKARSLGN